jgi:hypothetical protein
MIELEFIIPSGDGRETSSGEHWRFQCAEGTSLQVLFDAIGGRIGRKSVRLSVEVPGREMVALAALDPQSRETVASVGLRSGSRIIVGFEFSEDDVTTAVVADMRAIDKWCCDHPYAAPPPPAITYIAANKDLLLHLIDNVALMSQSDRAALQSKHRELDGIAVSPEFFGIARAAVEKAGQIESGYELAVLTGDDVHMIVRAVLYAQYSTTPSDRSYRLMLSPVRLPH